MNNLIKKKFSLISSKPRNNLPREKLAVNQNQNTSPKKLEKVELMPMFDVTSNLAKNKSKNFRSKCSSKKMNENNKMTEGAKKFLNLSNFFSDRNLNSLKQLKTLNTKQKPHSLGSDNNSNIVSSEDLTLDGKSYVVNIHLHIDKNLLNKLSPGNTKCKRCKSCKKKKPQKKRGSKKK